MSRPDLYAFTTLTSQFAMPSLPAGDGNVTWEFDLSADESELELRVRGNGADGREWLGYVYLPIDAKGASAWIDSGVSMARDADSDWVDPDTAAPAWLIEAQSLGAKILDTHAAALRESVALPVAA